MYKKKETKEKRRRVKSATIIPGWVLNVHRLIPHLDGVKEVHGASTTPSNITSYYLYQIH